MVRLLLVRHGETEWNEAGRCQGCSDVDLGATGLKQAEKLRERLAEESITAIYSSDLRRALHTARIIASPHGIEVVPREELREVDFGEFEGLTFEEIKRRYPQVDWWDIQNPDQCFPKGESVSQLMARVSQFVAELRECYSEGTKLIVAHGGPLRALLCLLLGFRLEHWWSIRLDNASLSIVETCSPGVVISLLNDVCHLRNTGNQEVI